MPEITAIKVNVKRPDRRLIYVDGKLVFAVSEGIFSQRDLREGAEISDKEIDELRDEDEFEKAKMAAFNLLSYRPRSIREINDRLAQKGWSTVTAQKVTKELEEKGYLNDREFAAVFAREKVKNKCLGPDALKSELFKTGVASNILEETVSSVYMQFSLDELIERLLTKRGIRKGATVTEKEKRRIINHLRRKGFNWDQMEPFIRELKLDQ